MIIQNLQDGVATAPMTENVDNLYLKYQIWGGTLSRADFFDFITKPSRERQRFLSSIQAQYVLEDNLFVKVLY